ncbi:MAG TPA: phytanoyl-CoA dioxygenase family protein [Candidatus Dormibacteraeota bacterium]|nr:phytanoyl-CoA dioxygenase family protein [Candidatus Dormibacteraeota bacterium]
MTFPPLDFDAWHRALRERLATPIGRMAARDVRDAPPFAWRLTDGRAYRFIPTVDALRVEPGDQAAIVAVLDAAAWRDFVNEIATAAGLVYGGRVQFVGGGYADLERWEPALRALASGRPIFDPRSLALRDGDGGPFDLARAFTLEAPLEPLRHFLHEAGFALVKGVFRGDEIARLVEIVERRQAQAAPGDGHSWWAKRGDGSPALCRLIYLGLVEPAIAALGDDPRLRRLAALAGEPLRVAGDRSDGHSVVIKNPGIAEGLSDLPWHRDCGLGGHPLTCPAINIGIQLDAATAASGQLHFAPGTWRSSCHRADLARAVTVAVDTEPGDCTVHFGDVMHAAPPPTGSGPGRRALYLSCLPERAFAHIPVGKSYNDTILARVGA